MWDSVEVAEMFCPLLKQPGTVCVCIARGNVGGEAVPGAVTMGTMALS